jgi:hypothetical protein
MELGGHLEWCPCPAEQAARHDEGLDAVGVKRDRDAV